MDRRPNGAGLAPRGTRRNLLLLLAGLVLIFMPALDVGAQDDGSSGDDTTNVEQSGDGDGSDSGGDTGDGEDDGDTDDDEGVSWGAVKRSAAR